MAILKAGSEGGGADSTFQNSLVRLKGELDQNNEKSSVPQEPSMRKRIFMGHKRELQQRNEGMEAVLSRQVIMCHW